MQESGEVGVRAGRELEMAGFPWQAGCDKTQEPRIPMLAAGDGTTTPREEVSAGDGRELELELELGCQPYSLQIKVRMVLCHQHHTKNAASCDEGVPSREGTMPRTPARPLLAEGSTSV